MRIAIISLLAAVAAGDECSLLKSCGTCTGSTSLACGWCDGTASDPGGPVSSCVSLNSSSWTCDGTFKSTSAQCACAGTNVPAELAHTWRGFFIDGTTKGEVDVAFSNAGANSTGRVIMKSSAGTKAGNVTSYSGCPKDSLQIAFDDGNKSGCAYRLNWQAGGDAFSLSLGCNENASAPNDFDEGNHSLQLYTCTDASHCDFVPPVSLKDLSHKDSYVADAEEIEAATVRATTCEALASCAECSKAAGCEWCLGKLSKAGVPLKGQGHCFAPTGAKGQSYTCQGLTLGDSCTVHKCSWYKYFEDKNCTALESSCAAPTTADDPDFHHQFPAAGYLTDVACGLSCVDPTIGCGNGGTCAKTHKCDPTSTCDKCESAALPAVMQGVEISNNFTAGLWTFRFNRSLNNHTYTTLNVTSPLNVTEMYKVTSFTGNTATLVGGSAGTSIGVRFDGLKNNGALGQNVYFAMNKDATIPSFGKVMSEAGASEFALLACEFDYAGRPISGQYKPLNCKVGSL